MSYSIAIEKDAEGIRIKHASGLEHIPDGIITISGHVPGPGLSPAATLAVTLAGPVGEHGYRQFVASASASYVAAVPAKPESEPAAGSDRGGPGRHPAPPDERGGRRAQVQRPDHERALSGEPRVPAPARGLHRLLVRLSRRPTPHELPRPRRAGPGRARGRDVVQRAPRGSGAAGRPRGAAVTRPVITDAHLQALERPPAAVWDRMSGYARQRWLRRHKAALRARPEPEPDLTDVPTKDTPLVERVTAYLEAVADHPRPLSQTQAARDLGITRDALRGALTRAGRQDLLDRLRHTRGGAG